ncbi:MAG: hypothetical protein HC844_21920 [Tabrizicola sp.]|nr:hypothetical protein [Tabrizicola sp.]
MSDKDDPFGLSNDTGRTRIRPATRSSPPGTAQHYTPMTPGSSRDPLNAVAAQSGPRVRHNRAHPNPLISAFSALLEFAPELEKAAPPSQPDVLRARLLDNLIDARDGAVTMGVPLARADQGAWLVAALLDDLALNTPWGGHSDWPRQPLVVSLYGDVDAGTRFFERMDDLQRFPDRDRQMLELGLVCLSLGFRGRTG